MEVDRTLFGRQWRKNENPEDTWLSKAIEMIHNPNGPSRKSVLAILKHQEFLNYHYANIKLIKFIASHNNSCSDFMKISHEISSLHRKIESGVENDHEFRPNLADFQQALIVSYKAKKG